MSHEAEERDLEAVCSKIEEESDFLQMISHDIWRQPELRFREVQAHAVLTCALRRRGFRVQKHYFMPTAFRAEFASGEVGGPTVALLLEYDALPEIGHACGHNLIAEAGLAAALGVKEAMERDPALLGKVVVLGTPGEEGGGGKIRLLELGAFEGADVALMVHPATKDVYFPFFICNIRYAVTFKGRETHAAASPWEGLNALDAAVSCYQALSMLRQHIEPACRIQAVIQEGGCAANVIPAVSRMEVQLRASTVGRLRALRGRVEGCFGGAAAATGCEVEVRCDEGDLYEHLLTNRTLGRIYKGHALALGLGPDAGIGTDGPRPLPVGSTDMGNVSRRLPAIHPLYAIRCEGGINHSRPFAAASGAPAAQPPTLAAAKALAMTALAVMRRPDLLADARREFEDEVETE